MPFVADDLSAIAHGGDGFTLWHYHSADSRAAITTAGYFTAAATLLKPGDLMVLQAGDALALLPVRSGLRFGPGSTLDGAVGAFAASRSVAQQFAFAQAAAPLLSRLTLAAAPSGVVTGASFSIAAAVAGSVTQVDFTLLNAAGAAAAPTVRATAAAGTATASFTAPAPGIGFRIRAVAVNDTSLVALTSSFVIGADTNLLLLQAGGALLTEAGARLQA